MFLSALAIFQQLLDIFNLVCPRQRPVEEQEEHKLLVPRTQSEIQRSPIYLGNFMIYKGREVRERMISEILYEITGNIIIKLY